MNTPLYRLLGLTVWVATCGVSWANYDEYMTCGSGSERYGRHYNHHNHYHLPCDITKDSWCESAGNQYPWGAVRKFVYENQGLMKRMYGNQRHYNVLKSELLNDLYDDMFDEMPKRQHQNLRPQVPTARSARYQKPSSANTFRTNSGKQGSAGQKTDRKRSSHESATKQRADHESRLNSRPNKQSRSNTRTSQESGSSSRTQESRSSSRTQESGSNSRTSQESGLSSRTIQESEGNQRTDSRAMKVSIVPEYSGVRRHHEQSRVKIQSKAPKIRRKTAGTRERPTTTTTTSTMPTTHQTTSTTNTGTTTSEIPLATTTEDVTTTESQWYDEDDYTEESQIPEYDPYVESDTQPPLLPLHPYQDDQEEGWTTLTDPSYAASSYSTPYSSYETESSYVSVTETSTSAYPTTHSDDILDDLIDDEGYISTPLDQDDLSTLTLTADFDDGTTQADLNDGADIWPADDEETTVDYDVDEGGMIVESEKLKVEMRESVDDGGLEVEMRESVDDVRGGYVEMRQSVDGVRVDDLRVEGNVQEEAKTEAPSESVHVQRPVRGMNACPVKEEFVAPYWANNTRGQTLALLNLYPFEQYVQWERCKFEHRQMYCRAGCRCEQQYRLHKLLAFDPTNECRGIFSDWFRFPSCCVCKCYDLPADIFTPSSRRPRINSDDEDDYEYIEEEEEEEEPEDEFDDYYPPPPPRPPYVNIPPQRRPRLPPRPYSHISPPSFTLRPPSPLPSDTPQPQDQQFSSTQARVNTRSHKFPSAQPRPNPPQTQNAQSRSDTRSQTYARGHERVAASRRFNHHRAGTRNRLTQNESTQRPEVSTLGTLDVATPHYYFNLTNYARVLMAKGQASPGLTRIPRSTEE